jgi:hypothetical protein
VASQVVFKREQERTEALPITYREYVYLVPDGTAEAVAGAFLLAQLEEVKTSLALLPAGRLVNLAVVDTPPSARPGAPLAALSWKDWSRDVAITFPRRPAPAQPSAEPAVPIELVTRTRSSIQLRQEAKTSGDDRLADVFDAMSGLHFLPDAIEAGAFCLRVAMDAVASTAGLVHALDAVRSEFVVANALGEGVGHLLATHRPDSDPVLATCRREFCAVVIEAPAAFSEGARTVPEGARSILVAPLAPAGRFMGAIELWSSTEGRAFDDSDANVVAYIAAQFSDFIVRHGVVTDAWRIRRPLAIGSRRASR